ncbi:MULTISPECIES: carbamoyltransferase HypF [unclassified Amycolatopsis]|uniref:carbamoyltransferase HypF n=1 Tax=unclassified Amycolatopsis TaxID=2618356 RepID=UPI00287684BB|nr:MULTISPECIES: carbamoyltransferase HypF [unclassified Amycolatopsis]MDS0134674.1 carbamoyltransferase HypF [Amycolatopsis sp. 505]MDS0147427.1 carbamoyltransferase HypF [Amycolatopsis sp. CM201R]
MAETPSGDRVRIDVRGTVQGVGFRPFVHRLATELGVGGDVRNAGGHVVIRAAGGRVADFVAGLTTSAPPQARVTGIDVTALADRISLGPGFRVAASVEGRGGEVPPDLATCPECVRELFDPADRRYRYPFLTCTACGPRATILERLPYDRTRTTMHAFPLCAACAAEYRNPADRRFHAEPIACPTCGPRLSWAPDVHGEEALAAACAVLAGGGIVAMKGLGGYQLVCDAVDESAVRRIRQVKDRPAKPLAVLARCLGDVGLLSEVDEQAAGVLTSAAAPIVLLSRRPGAPLADGIAPGLAEIGVFLPTTPLHHLLLAELRRPLVVTSGNRAGGPMVVDDAEALATLGPVTDGVLAHDRPIRSRSDDSVVRPRHGRTTTIRRARGYAPAPLPLPFAAPEPLLALGAQLKHTCALARDGLAHLGPHTGDLEDARTLAAFECTAADLVRWLDAEPVWCAHDLHPGYLSTQHARRWPAERRIGVQHHHAHVAATAAEHGVSTPFVGVALDGLGLGDDGTLWGGEVLLAGYREFRRFARFATAPLPGGAAAVRRPARMALGYLYGAESFDDTVPGHLAGSLLTRVDSQELAVVRTMIARDVNCPRASSAGRLFDAVSALLGLCDDNSYEGEAAIRLEAAAMRYDARKALGWELHERDGLWVYDPVPTLRDALQSAANVPAGEVAARFHRTIAEVVVTLAVKAADAAGTDVVCLGGGVFQNSLLTANVVDGLTAAGLRPLTGARVPMNDGGISYGQAAIACARMNGR